MRPIRGHASRTAAVAWTLSLGALPLAAQRPSSLGGESATSWTPASIGIHVGWDAKASGSLVGGQVHLPLLPSGSVEVIGTGDLTFVRGTDDKQIILDLVYVSGGRGGGLYVGGGIGWRKGIFTPGTGEQTVMSRGFVLGLRQDGVFAVFGLQAEFRWLFLSDVGLEPQPAAFGINLPLWGWSSLDRAGRR